MRDDFAERIKFATAARVGHCCSNPDCRCRTSGPRAEPEKAVNIGVAAHISAASPKGPRYNPDISPQERRSISNAIWLCQNCAKLIDNDETHYTVELLRDWKIRAEETARADIQKPKSPSDFSATPGFIQFLELLLTYVDEQDEKHGEISISSFTTWIKSEGYFQVTPEIQRIVNDLRINPTSGNNILRALAKKLRKDKVALPTAITEQMSNQINQLYDNLLGAEHSQKEKHRLEVSARLLEIASRNLIGAGMRSDLGNAFRDATPGTLTFRWRVGDASPDMMLVELVGGVLESRISVILRHDNSVVLRVYDPVGRKIVIVSGPYLPRTVLQIGVTWSKKAIAFWIQGKLVGKEPLQMLFAVPWVMLLAGIDVEGNLSADTIKQGYEVDGLIGLNLGRNGLWHGAQMRDIAIGSAAIPPKGMKELAQASDEEVEHLKASKLAGI
jgi:hypothetical protein